MENSILASMIREDDKQSKLNIFTRYKDKSEIGLLILNDFISKKYSHWQKARRGFFISENERSKIGLISNCLGLQTISLFARFGIDVLKTDEKLEMRSIIEDTIERIFSDLTLTAEKVESIIKGHPEDVSLVYSASPYFDNDDVEDDSLKITFYTDSASKVLETMSEFRTMLIFNKKNGDVLQVNGCDDLLKWVEALIYKSMYDINEAALTFTEPLIYKIGNSVVLDKTGHNCEYKGWNFTKFSNSSSADPSLFFTYSVCSAYMAFSGSMSYAINTFRSVEKNMSIEDLTEYKIPEVPLTKKEEFNANLILLRMVYKEYRRLNKRCVDAGHNIDYLCNKNRINLTQNFVSNNFRAVTYDEIINSTINDAPINTLLVISILIYSGCDLDYDAYGSSDEFLDMLQYSIQNIMKLDKTLSRTNKEYIIEQQVLSFNEVMPSECQDMIKLLRKQKIAVVSLMPLLIKNFTAISKYIIRYPQKEMAGYLTNILNNRCIDKKTGNDLWLWSTDGYNISVNMMYILNLLDFYDYYEKYELPLFNSENDNNLIKEQIEKSYLEEVEKLKIEHNEELAQREHSYQQTIDELSKKISELEVSKDSLKPIEKDIYEIIGKYIKENLNTCIAESFADVRKANNNGIATELSINIRRMMMSYFKETIIDYVDVALIGNDDKYDSLEYTKTENILCKRIAVFMESLLRKETGK